MVEKKDVANILSGIITQAETIKDQAEWLLSKFGGSKKEQKESPGAKSETSLQDEMRVFPKPDVIKEMGREKCLEWFDALGLSTAEHKNDSPSKLRTDLLVMAVAIDGDSSSRHHKVTVAQVAALLECEVEDEDNKTVLLTKIGEAISQRLNSGQEVEEGPDEEETEEGPEEEETPSGEGEEETEEGPDEEEEETPDDGEEEEGPEEGPEEANLGGDFVLKPKFIKKAKESIAEEVEKDSNAVAELAVEAKVNWVPFLPEDVQKAALDMSDEDLVLAFECAFVDDEGEDHDWDEAYSHNGTVFCNGVDVKEHEGDEDFTWHSSVESPPEGIDPSDFGIGVSRGSDETHYFMIHDGKILEVEPVSG